MESTASIPIFAALAHPDRLAIVRLLARRAPDAMRPAEIMAASGLEANTLSNHLDGRDPPCWGAAAPVVPCVFQLIRQVRLEIFQSEQFFLHLRRAIALLDGLDDLADATLGLFLPGMPRQGRTAQFPIKFPDVRLQYHALHAGIHPLS